MPPTFSVYDMWAHASKFLFGLQQTKHSCQLSLRHKCKFLCGPQIFFRLFLRGRWFIQLVRWYSSWRHVREQIWQSFQNHLISCIEYCFLMIICHSLIIQINSLSVFRCLSTVSLSVISITSRFWLTTMASPTRTLTLNICHSPCPTTTVPITIMWIRILSIITQAMIITRTKS